MNILEKNNFISFGYPRPVKRLICCDFDETYMPHDELDKQYSGIPELECYIDENNDRLLGVIGWITGSSILSIINKSKGYISKFPHFIAASLGTELYWIIDRKLQRSIEWENQIRHSRFDKKNINKIISKLTSKGAVLQKQKDDFQGEYIESYYYFSDINDENNLSIIKALAFAYNIKAEISHCNPAAGDPKGCFDVLFIPICCGKKEVLIFISNSLQIPLKDTWAFGDSFNDYEMLMCAGNSFIVANADPIMKEKMNQSILSAKYCHGIVNTLKKIQL